MDHVEEAEERAAPAWTSVGTGAAGVGTRVGSAAGSAAGPSAAGSALLASLGPAAKHHSDCAPLLGWVAGDTQDWSQETQRV